MTTTNTPLEPPWEVGTPKGKAYALRMIDYSQESYVYFVCAIKDTGEFWIYRNTEVYLWWNETTKLGRRPENVEQTVKQPRATQPAWAGAEATGDALRSALGAVKTAEEQVAIVNAALTDAWDGGYRAASWKPDVNVGKAHG